MTNQSFTFDINKFIFVFGASIVSGFAAGTFVEVTYDAPLAVYTQGTDGEVLRVLRNKTMATIKLSLMQSSKTNDELNAILLADIAGNIQEPLSILDLTGRTVLVASQCSIEQYPTLTFGDEAQVREWMLKAAKLKTFVGGSIA